MKFVSSLVSRLCLCKHNRAGIIEGFCIRLFSLIFLTFVFRQQAVELKKRGEERKQAEEAFYRNQELMMEAEKQRRDLILLEEKKLADQRVRYGHDRIFPKNFIPTSLDPIFHT